MRSATRLGRRFFLRTLISMAGLIGLAVMAFAGVFAWQAFRDHMTVVQQTAFSPDGKIQARLLSDTGENGYPEYYSLRLKPGTGKPIEVAQFQHLARYPNLVGADLVWLDNNTLEIHYLSGRRISLREKPVMVEGQARAVRLLDGWLGSGAQALSPPCPNYNHPCR